MDHQWTVSGLSIEKIVLSLCQTVISSHGKDEAAFTGISLSSFYSFCSFHAGLTIFRLSTTPFLVHRFTIQYIFGLTGALQGKGKN